MRYTQDDNGRFRTIDVKYLNMVSNFQNLWYETEEEIEAGLEWGKQKVAMLRRVREAMKSRLTPRQRECVTMYFFKGMTYEEIGRATHTNPAAAYRATMRGVRILQWALKKRERRFCDFSSE